MSAQETQNNKETRERIINDEGLDVLFREAHTYTNWQKRDVSDVTLKALYDLLKWGPTSANCCPARFHFVKSKEAKERLKPHLMEGNVDQTMTAPVTAIIVNDLEFYENLPHLYPFTDAKSWFVGKPDYIAETAMRNGTLQGAYMIMAARSLGLDCGPMSGFNQKGVKEEFFPDDNVQVNFLCNLGYGTMDPAYERAPRLAFSEACEIL